MDIQAAPVAVRAIPEGVRVAVLGPVHINTSWLESELAKVVAAKPKLVELDLGATPFVSSSGIGVLVSFRNRILGAGGTIKTVAIQRPVLGTLRLARLLDPLWITEETAVLEKT